MTVDLKLLILYTNVVADLGQGILLAGVEVSREKGLSEGERLLLKTRRGQVNYQLTKTLVSVEQK